MKYPNIRDLFKDYVGFPFRNPSGCYCADELVCHCKPEDSRFDIEQFDWDSLMTPNENVSCRITLTFNFGED